MVDVKREAVKAMYPRSKQWHKRVDRMSDAQVTAIYIKKKESK